MQKQLWYTFYIGTALGILVALVVRSGFIRINQNLFSNAISSSIKILKLSGSNVLYFQAISVIAIFSAFLIAAYHLLKTMQGSGEYGKYVFFLGLLGGFILLMGFSASWMQLQS